MGVGAGAGLGIEEPEVALVDRNLFDHQELGAELLSNWRLPEDIYTPIRYHHRHGQGELHNSLGFQLPVGQGPMLLILDIWHTDNHGFKGLFISDL